MASTNISDIPSTTTREVQYELDSHVRVYKDGSVERLAVFPTGPPLHEGDPQTGVLSKDVVICKDTPISARIYLPKLTAPSNVTQQQKLPIVVYFHGGAFCVGSAYALCDMLFLNNLVSQANVITISIEYRLAPDHPLPAAYEDCWAAVQWVSSHFANSAIDSEPWLINHGNFHKFYVAGESAGGNIVHNVLMRAGVENLPGDVKILGAFMTHPYFWGSKPIGSEPVDGHEQRLGREVWNFAYPSATGGIDNPMINPMAPGAPSLAGLACSKLFVCVAGKDFLRERGVLYTEAVRKSGWEGELELFEAEEEGHFFHIKFFGSENSKRVVKRLASFLN